VGTTCLTKFRLTHPLPGHGPGNLQTERRDALSAVMVYTRGLGWRIHCGAEVT